MKKVGIIGITGKLGSMIADSLMKSGEYMLGPSFAKSWQDNICLGDVFIHNDFIIDASNAEFTKTILLSAIAHPKPLIICTTGFAEPELIQKLSAKSPIVVASNNSFGAFLQRTLTKQLAELLGAEFDIDIIEKHHRNKIDIPSGTATKIIETIQQVKSYQAQTLEHGPRPDNIIGLAATRSGYVFGEHEVIFSSEDEIISIKHTALNRNIFAKGALKILDWLKHINPKAGSYTIDDVFARR